MSATTRNPFADLVRVATRPAPAPAPEPCGLPAGHSKTSHLMQLLRENGRISTGELARTAKLTSRQVWGLLGCLRKTGNVSYRGGLWECTDPSSRPSVIKAVQMLRDLGYSVQAPPGASK